MPVTMMKNEAHELVEKMPENATWDDLIHEIYVHEVIERGPVHHTPGGLRGTEDAVGEDDCVPCDTKLKDLLQHRKDARLMPQHKQSLEELAVQQGVGIITDFDALLGDFWPEEEDIEDFLATIRKWRREGGAC